MSLDVKELSAIEIKGNSFLVSKNSINAVTQNTSVRINKSSDTKPQDTLQECDKTDLFLMSADESFPMRAKQLPTENAIIRNKKKRKRKQTKQEKKILKCERHRQKKETMSQEDLERWRIQRNRRKAELIALETPEQRNLRLYEQKICSASRRRKERLSKEKTRKVKNVTSEERKRINAQDKQWQREKQRMNETAEERKERLAKHAKRTAELRKARKSKTESNGYTSTSSSDLLSVGHHVGVSRSSLPRAAKQRCTLNSKIFLENTDSDDDDVVTSLKSNKVITMFSNKISVNEREATNHLDEHTYSRKPQTDVYPSEKMVTNLPYSPRMNKEINVPGVLFEACKFFTDDTTVKMQTGIDSLENLCLIFRFLEDRIVQQSSDLPTEPLPLFEQFCLTLMSLRLNLEPRDIAMRYNLPEFFVSSFVNRFISDMMEFLAPTYIQWEKREDMTFLSGIFNSKPLKNCVCIVIFLKVNTLQSDWSLKYLIAFSPTGLVSYVSTGLFSTLDDVELLKGSSEFLMKISKGDQLVLLTEDNDNIEFFEGSKYRCNKIIKSSVYLSNDMLKELLLRSQSIINAFKFRFSVLHKPTVSRPSHSNAVNCITIRFFDRLVKVCCALHNVNLPVS